MTTSLEGYQGLDWALQSRRDRWVQLCARYLSVAPEKSIWRYSRRRNRRDPDQGWKLHVSATVLRANSVLETIGPFLEGRGILFKGPASLEELNRLNSGIHYGYTQVGKCLTIYPQTTSEAVALAEQLHNMTAGTSAPAVPFDLKFRPGSCVHYRYGAFQHQEIENRNGKRIFALRSPEGRLVPDVRNSPAARPDWMTDPFVSRQCPEDAEPTESPLKTTYRVIRALSQRGKGGVYLAVDLSVCAPRLCVVKEGRKDGEPAWDGRDGRWRVKNEKTVLDDLRAIGVSVPRVYASFEVEGNFYLVTEFIEGVSLGTLLTRRKRRLPVARVIHYGVQIARLLSQLHTAGWVWGDCKPSNLMVGKGLLRPIDFEGAGPVNQTLPMPWGSPAFAPPESSKRIAGRSRAADDLYALGVTIYHLLSGRFPSGKNHASVENLGRRVPIGLLQIVSGLLDPSPGRRPSARFVSDSMEALLPSFSETHQV